MAKFNYQKWILENKYGTINEQQLTGSFDTGSVEPFANNEWNPNLSGCGNFNNLPGNVQQLACQAYFNLGDTNNPSLTMWVQGGSCCPTGSMATGSIATGSFAGGGMTTGSMAQGMPSMTRRPQRKRPQRRLRENKNLKENKKMNLKNIKNTIKKALIELNEQKAMGGMDGMARQEYGGLVRCWCGAGESPETCDGVMIGNKVNCTCCGKPVCMDTIDSKGI